MIGAVAAIISLLYALQLPLCVAVVLEISNSPRVGVGVGTFNINGAQQRALHHMHQPAPKPGRKWMEKTGWFDELLHGAKYLYAHRLMLRVSVNGEIGGTDAARLAVCWGAAQGLLDTLCACTDGRISGTLRANFAAVSSHAEIRLTYAVKMGNIVSATLQVVSEHLTERVRTWKSIPLKV